MLIELVPQSYRPTSAHCLGKDYTPGLSVVAPHTRTLKYLQKWIHGFMGQISLCNSMPAHAILALIALVTELNSTRLCLVQFMPDTHAINAQLDSQPIYKSYMPPH